MFHVKRSQSVTEAAALTKVTTEGSLQVLKQFYTLPVCASFFFFFIPLVKINPVVNEYTEGLAVVRRRRGQRSDGGLLNRVASWRWADHATPAQLPAPVAMAAKVYWEMTQLLLG